MPISSTSRPGIRGKVLTRLPATLQATGGLSVSKENGIWTFGPDWTALALETTLPDPENRQLWVYDPLTETYVRLSMQAVIDELPAGPAGETGPAGPGYAATSVTSNAIASSGSKTFATQAGLAYSAGARVRVSDASAPTVNWMEGVVTSYSGTSLVFTADESLGSGTLTDWTINVAGQPGADGAGTGDFSSNTATSVDSEIVLFSGTGGKTGKRATGSGVAKVTSGVLGVTGTSDVLTIGTIELGAASDTTLSRSAAGVLAVEGVNVLTTATGAGLAPPQASYSFNLAGRLWGQGASAAPSSWTLTGASATVASNTTAGQFRAAAAGAALTRAGTDCKLTQNVAAMAGWTNLAGWGSKQVTFGRWVYATVASRVRIAIYDGSTRTYSSYHTGGSTLEFLTVTVTLGAPPTEVTLECHVDTGNTVGVFSGGAFALMSSMPSVAVTPVEWQGAKANLPITTTATTLSGTHAIFIGIDPGKMPVAHHGVLHTFYMIANAAPGTGETFTYTNRKNNSAGAVTCQIAGAAATTANDLTNQAYYSAGDGLDFLAVASAGAAAATHGGGVVFEEIPIAP